MLTVSLSQYRGTPIECVYAIIDLKDGGTVECPLFLNPNKQWGEPCMIKIPDEPYDIGKFKSVDVVWLSAAEAQAYKAIIEIPADVISKTQSLSDDDGIQYLLIGIAPYGVCALWYYTRNKSVLLAWVKGTKINLPLGYLRGDYPSETIDEYCHGALAEFGDYELADEGHYLTAMRQYTYRYMVIHNEYVDEQWRPYSDTDDRPTLDEITETLCDGTHDKTNSGKLTQYHTAGKPKKLSVSWHLGKKQYTAHFWLDQERISEIYDRFYGVHRDTKVDFIIKIDQERNVYELSLYRYGLPEAQVIPDWAYQMIVFKDNFERYRSANYDQPRGAWRL